jgi:prevent-host-death family protein
MIVNMHEAKSQLSRLVERARHGEEIVIAKDGAPVARLVALGTGLTSRQPGAMKGRIDAGDDFLAPLPEEELAAWER